MGFAVTAPPHPPLQAPWITQQARALLAQRGHAWLLHGASGLGQYELALELVRAWLCEQPQPDGLACGSCPGCHAIDVRAHHDLLVLMPETQMLSLGWPLPEKAQQAIDEKDRKPSQEIRVDAMRDMIEFAQLTNARGRGKAVLVHPADRMNTITANTLLKTLEEPPGDVRFVLTTNAANALLPTIRSRCIAHAMQWPQTAPAIAWMEQGGATAAQAEDALRGSGGRPFDALDAIQAGRDGAWWSSLPKAAARGDVAAFADLPPPELVQTLLKLCHDLTLVASGAPPRYFDRSTLPSAAPLARLNTWWRELTQAARHADHPFKAELMAESLVSQAQRVLNSRT